MTDTNENGKRTLTLTKKLDPKKTETDQVRQSFAHGRSKTVSVEVKRKRTVGGTPGSAGAETSGSSGAPSNGPSRSAPATTDRPVERSGSFSRPPARSSAPSRPSSGGSGGSSRGLTQEELNNRLKVVQQALQQEAIDAEERQKLEEEKKLREAQIAEEARRAEAERVATTPDRVLEERREDERVTVKEPDQSSTFLKEERRSVHHSFDVPLPASSPSEKFEKKTTVLPKGGARYSAYHDDAEEGQAKKMTGGTVQKTDFKKGAPVVVKKEQHNQPRKLSRHMLSAALSGEAERTRSLASLKRARQKQNKMQSTEALPRVVRDVTIPETITVSELANRMAVRGAEIVKALFKLGVTATINQVIDADTAELVCGEFGHKVNRVADSDIELGIQGIEDQETDKVARAPVVTVMGHVDHGKTSLLDALRSTDVVSGEAGGITQHIGAYQVTLPSAQKITFIDTPGHAAFTEMRSRGANVTDIVVLVVAADDGIKEQTIEAISHAKAAQVPIVVAINKMDKPEANPTRVKSELLQHGIVLEEFGGEALCVEVSAKARINLDKLEEAILLQAEVLGLKSNPNRAAQGSVVEARVDRGRGVVATILVQKGTLKVGDLFVVGTEYGRVRALTNDHGQKIEFATPSMPVEILGLNGTPSAGDVLHVLDSESKAKEIAEYRQQRLRASKSVTSYRTLMEQLMDKIAAGEAKELSIVVKADVHGSLEAILASLAKLATEEVSVRVLHGAVGAINESDIALARASAGLVIGFNVRANPQARELARKDDVEIRYYSIIYNVIEEVKVLLGGLLAPTIRENHLGRVEIREIFSVPKIGKIAGCYVLEGLVKRNAKVRLLRDDTVIHEGSLDSLRRFKDEVKEVRESYECGLSLKGYQDIQKGDVLEVFELEELARTL